MIKRNKSIVLFILSIFFAPLLFNNSVFAAARDSIIKKTMLDGVYQCYHQGGVKQSAGNLTNFNKFKKLLNTSNNTGDSDWWKLPNGLGLRNAVSCKQLFLGKGDFEGVFNEFGKSEYVDTTIETKKIELLTGLGYSPSQPSGGDTDTSCVYFVYYYTHNPNYARNPSSDPDRGEVSTNKVCLSGNTLSTEETDMSDNLPPITFHREDVFEGGSSNVIFISPADEYYRSLEDVPEESKVVYSSGHWNDFKTELREKVSSQYSNLAGNANWYELNTDPDTNDGAQNSPSGDVEYVITNSNFDSAGQKAIHFFASEYNRLPDIRFTRQEFLWYIANSIPSVFFENFENRNDYYTCDLPEDSSMARNYITINMDPFTNARNEAGKCGLNKNLADPDARLYNFTDLLPEGLTERDPSDFNLGDGYFLDDYSFSLEEVVQIINVLVDSMTDDDLDDMDDPSYANTPEEDCLNSGRTFSLGWFVCPILAWAQETTQKAYDDYVKPNLTVEPGLFQGDGDPTRNAWQTFQRFANICFVILFLIIIFSQLTGVGIDNYGIKKLLPKLIVVAILVNLSYLICLICVDLSNILGNGFQRLFESLPTGVSESDYATSDGVPLFVPVGIGAVIFGFSIWTNPAIILTLLISMLGLLISIFFLFLLLTARKAAIVVLVVIAPIAITCYLLPNTKKLFEKWSSAWKALLLLYPICGLLVGGGNYVSKLLLATLTFGDNTNGFFGGFTAMLVGIVPIFFIPTLLKSSFAALGNIGSKISGFGSNLRSGATSKLRGSEGFKNAQKMGQERKMRYRAGYSARKGGLTTIGRAKAKIATTPVGRFVGMNKRQAAYVEAAKKNSDINKESSAVLMSETAAANISNYLADHKDKAPKDYFWDQIASSGGNIEKLDSIILTAEKRGIKKKDIAEGIRRAANSGNLTFRNEQSRANWMNSMLQNHGDIMSTDYELQEWARQGGVSTLGNYGYFADKNIDASDVDISDYSKMSGNSLAAMIKAGKVSAYVAQQWLAANPNASADKKIMMGAVASGAVKGGFTASAEDFKKEAESLANGTTSKTSTIRDGVATNRPDDNINDLVGSWTSTAQIRTYISQDPSAMPKTQVQSEKNPVFVQEVNVDLKKPTQPDSTELKLREPKEPERPRPRPPKYRKYKP